MGTVLRVRSIVRETVLSGGWFRFSRLLTELLHAVWLVRLMRRLLNLSRCYFLLHHYWKHYAGERTTMVPSPHQLDFYSYSQCNFMQFITRIHCKVICTALLYLLLTEREQAGGLRLGRGSMSCAGRMTYHRVVYRRPCNRLWHIKTHQNHIHFLTSDQT